MSALDLICAWAVTRYGFEEPCEAPAVAWRGALLWLAVGCVGAGRGR